MKNELTLARSPGLLLSDCGGAKIWYRGYTFLRWATERYCCLPFRVATFFFAAADGWHILVFVSSGLMDESLTIAAILSTTLFSLSQVS